MLNFLESEEAKPDSIFDLTKKEASAVNHTEWIRIHTAGLLHLYESGAITKAEYIQRLIDERESLEKQSLVDHLTGILNRRGLDHEIQNKIKDAFRESQKTNQLTGSVIFFDVDRFKKINDTYGHDVGDQVLTAYAKTIKDCTRPGDVLGRYGGDEFVVFATGATEEQAKEIADRARENIIEEFKKTPVFQGLNQTISAGISQLRPNDTVESLCNRADKALAFSKEQGRNKTFIFKEDLSSSNLDERD